MEVIQHTRRGKMYRARHDVVERFFNFETFNGAFVFLPWGTGFLFYGWPWSATPETFMHIITRPQFGYNYALISIGIVLWVWGVRKVLVNRIKQRESSENLAAMRKDIKCYSTSN